MTRQDYIRKFTRAAIDSTKGTKLFPSLVMAQAILESSNKYGVAGASVLASQFNNHFGIKADSRWKGKKVNLSTREVYDGKDVIIGDYFRVYENAEQSFKDRNTFLSQNPRYRNAGVFNAPTPEAQAQALQRAGYATDPNYAQLLTLIIKSYDLKKLDEAARKNELSDSA
jgi:flagellum-specific peptidoglycan hydrolase FlgJ